MKSNQQSVLLTPFEVAKLASVKPQMVYAYLASGRLQYIYAIGPDKMVRRMIEEEEAIAWVDKLTKGRLERTKRQATKLATELKGNY